MDICVGTYSPTPKDNEHKTHGICLVFFNPKNGAFGQPRSVADCLNPSYLLLSSDEKTLFAVRETFSEETPALLSFRIEPKNALTPLSQIPIAGELPCHLAFDANHCRLASAQYLTGDVAICKVVNGELKSAASIANSLETGPKTKRQDRPHAHCVAFTDKGTVLHIVDLGTDSLTTHILGTDGKVLESTALHLPPGCGPRHIVINRQETRAYLFCELDESLIVLNRSGTGWVVDSVQPGFTAPEDGFGAGAAIRLSKDDRKIYISGRRQSKIACFSVAGEVRALGEFETGGETPRDFILTSDGGWIIVANQDSGTLASFRRNADTQLFDPSGHKCQIFKPVSLVELPNQC
jgi:6-phosphogluconolactonase